MVNIYSELDRIIADYVGYVETDEVAADGSYDFCAYDCADTVLYDNLTDECTMYIRDRIPKDKLSDDAKACIEEWEDLLQRYPMRDSNRDEVSWREYPTNP